MERRIAKESENEEKGVEMGKRRREKRQEKAKEGNGGGEKKFRNYDRKRGKEAKNETKRGIVIERGR